jgi:hypothetical protein
MAKTIIYVHSDRPGDTVTVAEGSILYEQIIEYRDPKTQKNQARMAELKTAIERSHLECDREFRKYWSDELIAKYFGRKK